MFPTNFARVGVFALLATTALASAAHAAAVVNSSSVFATGAAVSATAPDSVTFGDGSLFVSYAGGTDSQAGTGNSTIVQYSPTGSVQSTYSIAGSVDGLKVNPTTGAVWALQNQDGNSHLSLINPTTHAVTGPLNYGAPYVYGANSTRGYDDVGFKGSQVFLSYTNPNVPTDPVVQLLNNGNNPTGTLTTKDVLTANQIPFDADSLKVNPDGSLVLTAGDQGLFEVITNPGAVTQSTAVTTITQGGAGVSGLDDVLFPSASSGTLFVTDTSGNRVLALNVSGLNPADPIVSIGSLNELATVDPATGIATPFFNGDGLGPLNGPHGLEFVAAAVPEPASLALLGGGVLAMLGMRRRRAA